MVTIHMRAAVLCLLFLTATSALSVASDTIHATSTRQSEPSHDLRGMLFHSPTLHATSSVKRLHPLLHYSISHEDGTPLLYFHPDTPKELRAKQSRVKKEKVAYFKRAMASQAHSPFSVSEPNPYDHTFARSSESVFPSTPFRTSKSTHIIQPFPDTLFLTIRLPSPLEDEPSNSQSPHVQDLMHHSKELVNIRLTVASEIFDWDSNRKASIRTGDGEEIASVPFLLTSYKGEWSDGWLVVTLHADGRFQLILHDQGSDGTIYQVDLVEHHYPDTDDASHFERIQRSAFQQIFMRDLNDSKKVFATGGHGMVVYTHSNYREELARKYQCGVTHQHMQSNPSNTNPRSHPRKMHSWDFDFDAVASTHQAVGDIRQSSKPRSAFARKLQSVSMWPNCFPGQTTAQRFSVGIIADTGYYQSFASDVSQIQAGLAQLFTWSNMIYNAQLNVVLTMTDAIMYATVAQTPNNQPPTGYSSVQQYRNSLVRRQNTNILILFDLCYLWYIVRGANFNEVPACAQTIDAKLSGVAAFRGQVEQGHDAIWHLVTNCWQTGTVGLAYIGSLCNGWAVGVSSRITDHYRAFAHEIGHNFGAQHTFGIGGLMDYGDARYPPGTGDFEFAPDNESQVCGYLTSLFNSKPSGFSPYCYQTTTIAPTAVCGNGIVEGTEACDDSSLCCDQTTCKLKAGMQCSKESECCNGSTCQFKPSTTTCSTGYCANGMCTASVCTGIGGIPTFCSVSASTPCKQSCKSSSSSTASCVTTWTTPNTNVPDGTICALSPLSTCNSGACVSTVTVTFTWVTGSWSTCSCAGIQTRAVQCLGSDGTVGSAAQCSGTAPAISQPCTSPSTCNTFTWQTTPWSDCNSTCQQSRFVNCLSTSTALASAVTVSDSLCPSAKPVASQVCNTVTCFFQWIIGPYTSCSQQCSGGMMNREVKCQQSNQGALVDVSPSFCSASTKPPTSTSCNTSPCSNYYLTYGTWGGCQASCVNGTAMGTQTRPATCVSQTAPTTPVPLSNCLCGPGTNTPLCPGTSQTCTSSATASVCPQPAPKNFVWRTGGWTSCSVSKCGGGTRTRTVSCYDGGGTVAADYKCTNAKPASVDNCNTQPCVSYFWSVSGFGGCSKQCGGGVQTRSVGCASVADGGQQPAPASNCPASTMPVSSQSCNTQSCSNAPTTYYWYVSDWSSCSKNCGGGIQFRQVWCAQTGSVARVSGTYCVKLSFPPSFFQSCNSRACTTTAAVEAPDAPITEPANANVTYMWFANEWSDCSRICGTGANRVRKIECRDPRSGKAVDQSQCNPILKPLVTSACTSRDCQTYSYWYMSEWSQCSAECNGGMETRQVECRLIHSRDLKSNATKLDDSVCIGTKPATVSSCNLNPCPTWVMGDWSPCSTSCGDGVQTRTAICVDCRGTTIDDSGCGMIPMPAATQACAPTACGFWQQDTTASWSPCTKKCNGGNSTLPLVCVLADGTSSPNADQIQNGQSGLGCAQNVIPGSAGVPPTTRACNIESCPPYYFDIRDYSECSKACGAGEQTGRAVCVQSRDDSIVPNSMCIGSPPTDTTRSCNTVACPDYEYLIATDWSACSVQCGVGVQTRTILCINNVSLPADPTVKRVQAVDFSRCLASIATAPPAAQRDCHVPESVCYGVAVVPDSTVDIAANGKCIVGNCLCRSGYTNQNCSGPPFLSNVRTSMDAALASSGTQAQPLAFKDKIEIRWDYQGQLDTVSVLITQVDTNVGVSQYIATDIPNTGRFLWHIGTNFVPLPLSDDLDAVAPSYRFIVWFSPSAFSTTSNLFTFSDPCAYLNCGVHGTCIIGTPPTTPLNRITSAATLTLPNRPDSAPAYCQCQQSSGFSGQRCEIGPCTSMKCDMTHGICNDETAFVASLTSNNSTVCNCTNGWTGAQCRTPVPECIPICRNGGDMNNVVTHLEQAGRVVDSCGRCQCTNQWTGSDCSQCALQCLNSGQPTPDCARCDCGVSTGWFGSRCECRYYLLTMHLSIAGMGESELISQWFADDDGTQVRLGILRTILQNGLMVSARQLDRTLQSNDSIMIEVVSFTQVSNCTSSDSSSYCARNIIEATVRFSFECPEQSLLIVPSPRMANTIPSASSAETNPALLNAYNRYTTLFANLDSPIYRGVFTSQLDHTITIRVSDPTGLDSPQSPAPAVDPFYIQRLNPINPGGGTGTDQPSAAETESTSITKEGWMGIIVGIAVFIILACLVAFAIVKYRKKQEAQQAEKIRKLEELGLRAMSPNPALQSFGTELIQLQPISVPSQDQAAIEDNNKNQSSSSPPPVPNTTPASNMSGMTISGPRYNYTYKNPYLDSQSTLARYPRGLPSLSISPRALEEHLAELQEPSVFPNEMTRVKSKSPQVVNPSDKI